jgi:hypothetical protein
MQAFGDRQLTETESFLLRRHVRARPADEVMSSGDDSMHTFTPGKKKKPENCAFN